MAQSVTPLAVLEAKPRTETDCPYGPWKQRELRDRYRENKLSDPLYHESRGTEISWYATPALISPPPFNATWHHSTTLTPSVPHCSLVTYIPVLTTSVTNPH